MRIAFDNGTVCDLNTCVVVLLVTVTLECIVLTTSLLSRGVSVCIDIVCLGMSMTFMNGVVFLQYR